MQNHEQLVPREIERKKAAPRTNARASVTASEAEKLHASRTAMLLSVKERLSPLMHTAIEIKLAHEKEDLDELIATEAKAEAERIKRRGVLDPRFFRKKSLPNH